MQVSHGGPIYGRMVEIPHFIGEGLASLGNTPLDVKTEESGDTGSNPERPTKFVMQTVNRTVREQRFQPSDSKIDREKVLANYNGDIVYLIRTTCSQQVELGLIPNISTNFSSLII